ncbi:MFS antiporter QDR2 [Candida viswanathii]|uniref:MFS antiporter QDR2 n=1 Tax=Candida viswanathii TaxID=5486 RepID=A0A367Y148_9ASCO|nr:MFS antiporter QDR2 [Candida viswanathii]
MADSTATIQQQPPWTILTTSEKVTLVVLISCSGIWSTLSTSIYFPALPELSHDFDVSLAITNISVVAYLIFQGITPTFVATVADTYGRRPCVIYCLVGYCAVNIAISRVDVYWLLAVLRCVQAATISPIIAVSAGTVSDITTKANRGRFIGGIQGIQLVGQGFGALVGAGIISGFGWRGVFIVLAIGSGAVMMCMVLVFPETNRKIVGNLSVPPAHAWNKAPILYVPYYKKRLTNDTPTIVPPQLPNFLDPFRILVQPTIFITLLAGGFQFATWTMCLTTLSTSLEKYYGYLIVTVGLCYLAPGIGTLVGAVLTGRTIDLIYARKRNTYNRKYGHLTENEKPEFDLFAARFEMTGYTTMVAVAFCVVFAWCLDQRVHVAPILVALFFVSAAAVAFLSCMNTLLVDLFPDKGSSASSCLNLVRCLLSALFVGVLDPMQNAMGIGGCFTFMAGLCFLSYLLLGYFSYRSRKGNKKEIEK